MPNNNVGDKIFSLFLETLCSAIISITHVKSYMSMNTAHEQARHVNKHYGNRRFTTSLGSLNQVCKAFSPLSLTHANKYCKEKHGGHVLRAGRRSSRLHSRS